MAASGGASRPRANLTQARALQSRLGAPFGDLRRLGVGVEVEEVALDAGLAVEGDDFSHLVPRGRPRHAQADGPVHHHRRGWQSGRPADEGRADGPALDPQACHEIGGRRLEHVLQRRPLHRLDPRYHGAPLSPIG